MAEMVQLTVGEAVDLVNALGGLLGVSAGLPREEAVAAYYTLNSAILDVEAAALDPPEPKPRGNHLCPFCGKYTADELGCCNCPGGMPF